MGDLWETYIGTYPTKGDLEGTYIGRIGTYIGLPEVSQRYLVAYMEVSHRSPIGLPRPAGRPMGDLWETYGRPR